MEKLGKLLGSYAEKNLQPQNLVDKVNQKILFCNISTVATIAAAIFTLFSFSVGAIALTGVALLARIYFGDQLNFLEIFQMLEGVGVTGGNTVGYIFINPIHIKLN